MNDHLELSAMRWLAWDRNQNRELYLDKWPRQFYFLVPEEIGPAIKQELPPLAGLAYTKRGWTEVHVHTVAPINRHSKKIGLVQWMRMMQGMRNHLMVSEINNYSLRHPSICTPEHQI